MSYLIGMSGDSKRFLGLAIAAMFAALLTVVFSTFYVSRVLGGAARDLSDNAAPSIVALDGADAQLRLLEEGLVAQERGGQPATSTQRAAAHATIGRLSQAVDRYTQLPAFPGETTMWADLHRDLATVKTAAERVLEPQGDAQARALLDIRLDTAVHRLDRALRRASRFNAENAVGLSHRIDALRRSTLPAMVLLDVLGVVLAAAAIFSANRVAERARRQEQQAHDALALRAGELEAFAGRVAHDLLSPLMTVNIALGLAAGRSTVEGDELSREQLARAERSLSNVRTLVEGLLEFARSGARPAPGATALVDQVVRTVADDCTPLVEDVGARIEVEADDASSVACSSGVLMSLVGNLMHNALRSVRGQPERRVTVRAHTEGDFVRLEVSDTGPGVHPALRDSLFEPHVQGPDHGRLGLGLATVKRLIDSHGGRVGFENRAGHGATFWFELPAARADRTKHP